MGGKVATSYREKVEEQIRTHPVLMYGTTYCSWCVRAEGVFRMFRVEPHVVHFDKDENGEEIAYAVYEITGQNTVPCIFIGGKHIGGFSQLMQGLKSGYVQNEFRRLKIDFEDYIF
jgi:glutaredoxin 3